MSEDKSRRHLRALKANPRQLPSGPDYQRLATGDQIDPAGSTFSFSAADLFTRLAQHAPGVGLILWLDAAPDSSQFDNRRELVSADRPHAIQITPLLAQNQARADKGPSGNQILKA